ncbi:MAG: hypothetical protein L0H31_00870 [Nocardioidaceae bacterium]|nr:hypothetical protein [Nocardioidaceae bacterium]
MRSTLPAPTSTAVHTRRRLRLRPGTAVMTREPGVLQIGLDDPCLCLEDVSTTREMLQRLDQAGGIDLGPRTWEDDVLRQLDEAGLLVVVADNEPGGDPIREVMRAQFGRDAERRRDLRTQARIAVHAEDEDAALVTALLDRVGVAGADPTDLAAPVHLVVARGPIDRELLDPLVQGSVPHLVLSGAGTRRRVGPFVEPGRTACQRCVDAHEALHDARWPLLLCQAARKAARRPPPRDPLLDQIAFAWAVRDLCRYLEGEEPSTWSTTVDLDPSALAQHFRWGRHPDCGCAWDVIDLL